MACMKLSSKRKLWSSVTWTGVQGKKNTAAPPLPSLWLFFLLLFWVFLFFCFFKYLAYWLTKKRFFFLSKKKSSTGYFTEESDEKRVDAGKKPSILLILVHTLVHSYWSLKSDFPWQKSFWIPSEEDLQCPFKCRPEILIKFILAPALLLRCLISLLKAAITCWL